MSSAFSFENNRALILLGLSQPGNLFHKKNNEPKEIAKVDAVIKLLLGKPNGTFLLFSNYDQTFENLIKSLNDKKH